MTRAGYFQGMCKSTSPFFGMGLQQAMHSFYVVRSQVRTRFLLYFPIEKRGMSI
jgi:hypothetical protein